MSDLETGRRLPTGSENALAVGRVHGSDEQLVTSPVTHTDWKPLFVIPTDWSPDGAWILAAGDVTLSGAVMLLPSGIAPCDSSAKTAGVKSVINEITIAAAAANASGLHGEARPREQLDL